MPSSFGRLVLGLAVLGTGSIAQAYFLDSTRNFDVRLRAYSQIAVAAQSSREEPPTFNAFDLFSHRNFYNPEFDAKLTDYVGWMRGVRGLSVLTPDDFKFHFAWWGFYDGMFDYLAPQWRDALRAVPRTRQSSSDDISGESTKFNDENKNPRNILGARNRINELYLDFSKGRLFTHRPAIDRLGGGRLRRLHGRDQQLRPDHGRAGHFHGPRGGPHPLLGRPQHGPAGRQLGPALQPVRRHVRGARTDRHHGSPDESRVLRLPLLAAVPGPASQPG